MLHRRIATALIVLMPIASAAARVSCPRVTVSDDGALHTLADAHVFQGPESGNAQVMPVHGTYDIAALRVKDAHASFTLACVYNGTTQTQSVEIPPTATTCVVADAGSGTVAACQ